MQRFRAVAERLAARAEQTDRSPGVPREHLEWLAQAGAYRLGVPAELGGEGAPPSAVFEMSELLSAACGVTQFVHDQHLSSTNLLARLGHPLLGELMQGRSFCGVAFGHLRRPGPPAVRAIPQGEGYRFEGEAPWFTGWGLFDRVILAGVTSEGQQIYALVPTAGLQASEPLQLCAMNASATVCLRVDGVVAPALRVQTAEEMAENDIPGILRHSAQPLGVARAALEILRSRAPEAARRLEEKARELRERALAWDGDAQEAVRIRAACNELSLRAAQAAVVASGGGANLLTHPAQRLVREAMFYVLTQLNTPLRQEALRLLSEDS